MIDKKIYMYFCLLLAALCIAWTPAAFGQTATGQFEGRILDPSGAAVPGADIAVVNVATSVKRTAQSDAGGRYTVPLLMPGIYKITVTKAGFTPAQTGNITLEVNATITEDVNLTVGALTQSVEVKGEADLIQTATSELGTVVGSKPTADLPLNGRNFTQLLTLVPGITPVNTSQINTATAWNNMSVLGVPTATFDIPSVSGQWMRSNMYLVDGVNDTEFNTSVYVIPPIVDTIQEFKVQMHNDKAEYGGVLGGVISVISKGGTNKLHGSAYEFVRNNWFDARNPFIDEFRSSPSPFRQNQFGGTIGGPVLIPKLYNGRNRTFFYFAYEGIRFTQAAESRGYVPTAAELQGNFTQSLVDQNIYDPSTTREDPENPGEYIRTQFSYQGVANIIPPTEIDQKMVSFMNTYFDRPNLTGDPIHNLIVPFPGTNTGNEYSGRLDEQLGNKDNFFFHWSSYYGVQETPTSLQASSGGNVEGRQIAAGWNHLFSPDLIMEARGGATERPFAEGTTDTKGIAPMEALGFTSPGGSTIALASPWGGGGVGSIGLIGSPSWHISGNLSWVHKAHNAKFGVNFLRQGNYLDTKAFGTYTFGNTQTDDPELTGSTGASLASALIGLPAQTQITNNTAQSERFATWSGYAQDEWKIRPNITLTYGLRFDLRRPFSTYSPSDFIAGPVPETGNYWIGLSQMPGLCSVVGQAPCLPQPLSQITNGSHIQLSPYGVGWLATEKDDWGPRIGLAWRLNNKTVVRGGYGIVYDPLSGIDQDWKGIQGGWPAPSGFWSILGWNQLGAAPTTIEQTFGKIGVALPTADPWEQENWYFDPEHKDARSQQWNVEIQRQLTNNLALTIGYQGSHSDRLDQTTLWNIDPTPGPGTAAQIQANRPFPWWSGDNFMGTSHGAADFNGLEMKLERRFSNGFNYLVSYTWSKTIDLGSSGWFDAEEGSGAGVQNPYDPKGSRSVAAYDVPQFLSMSGVYELPFGRGKKYFNQHGAASWIVGNWQTNVIAQLRSGQPYTVAVSGDVANIGNSVSWFNYARPNLVGDPHVSNPTSEDYLNEGAFQVPSYSYGNLGRNTMRSAPDYNVDFSLFKNFPFSEGKDLTFRMEFFNVFNIQTYAAPDALVGDPGFGHVTSTVGNSRQIQLALRLTF